MKIRLKLNKFFDEKYLVFIFFLIFTFGLKFPVINMPYTRDAISVYVWPSLMLKNAGFNPLLLGIHPPFYYELLALTLRTFGESLLVGHIFNLVFTLLLVFYTYLLGRLLYNSVAGFFAALLLFFSPLVFAQSGLVHLEIPFAFFSIATIYYYLKDKILAYTLFGSMLVLTKEPSVLVILGVLIYHLFFRNGLFKKDAKSFATYARAIKDNGVYLVPLVVISIWFLINKYAQGWAFHPSYLGFFQITVFPHEFLRRLHQLFFENYHFIITTAIIICLLPIKKFYYRNKSLFYLIIVIPIILFLACYFINPLIMLLKYFGLDIIKIIGKDLSELYLLKFSISYLSFLFLFLIFYTNHGNLLSDLKERFVRFFGEKVLLLSICTFIIILFFSFMRYGYQNRYLTLAYPFFFVIGVASVQKLTKKQHYFLLIVSIILSLFIIQWYDNSRPIFQTCEENMRYLDVIETHAKMSKFIEENYEDKTILTEVPQLDELQFPFAGYVEQPLKAIEGETDPFRRGINKTLAILPRDSFDLVYFSNGGCNEDYLRKTVNIYNLSLIQKFEKSGKIAYLYG